MLGDIADIRHIFIYRDTMARVWHTVAYFEGTILLDLCAAVGHVGSSRPVRRVVVQRATVTITSANFEFVKR